MNRLRDCFGDDDAGDVSAVPLFQGMRHDPGKPLFEHRPRAIHPGIARWMDQEPLGYVDGMNTHNAPVDGHVSRINPLGT